MSTPDFFRSRLDQMIGLRHPLAVLATRLPWATIEAAVAPKLAHQAKPAKSVAGEDLAGAFDGECGGGISLAGRPRLPIRLMVSLLYLKNSFNLSDEGRVERWAENVVWQFFSGMDYYEPRLPCDATQIGRFRRLLGEGGIEQLLQGGPRKLGVSRDFGGQAAGACAITESLRTPAAFTLSNTASSCMLIASVAG